MGLKLTILVKYLDRLGDGPALPVLNILTTLLSDISTFLTSDVLVSCLLLLVAILDWLLGALLGGYRLPNSLLDVPALLLRNGVAPLFLFRVIRLLKPELCAAKKAEFEELLAEELVGETSERQEKERNENNLHVE